MSWLLGPAYSLKASDGLEKRHAVEISGTMSCFSRRGKGRPNKSRRCLFYALIYGCKSSQFTQLLWTQIIEVKNESNQIQSPYFYIAEKKLKVCAVYILLQDNAQSIWNFKGQLKNLNNSMNFKSVQDSSEQHGWHCSCIKKLTLFS